MSTGGAGLSHQGAPNGLTDAAPVLRITGLDVELGEGRSRATVLRGVDLELRGGERVVLMGRNGAGKSTLLRAAAGLTRPLAGRIEAERGVALLPQRPSDLIVHERVADELRGDQGQQTLAELGLTSLAERDPRDLSGGERQRLAIAIALAGRGPGGGHAPGAVLLDEPTRGMDRERKADLATLCCELTDAGAAVVIATHDAEFAASFADRVILLGGQGRIIADGPAAELLAGGWYFSTEIARVLGGAAVGLADGLAALRPAETAAEAPR